MLKVSGLGSKDVRACFGRFSFATNSKPVTGSSFGTRSATEHDDRTHSGIQCDDYDKSDACCTYEMDRINHCMDEGLTHIISIQLRNCPLPYTNTRVLFSWKKEAN